MAALHTRVRAETASMRDRGSAGLGEISNRSGWEIHRPDQGNSLKHSSCNVSVRGAGITLPVPSFECGGRMSDPTIRIPSCRQDGRCPECGKALCNWDDKTCPCGCLCCWYCVNGHLLRLLTEALRLLEEARNGQ